MIFSRTNLPWILSYFCSETMADQTDPTNLSPLMSDVSQLQRYFPWKIHQRTYQCRKSLLWKNTNKCYSLIVILKSKFNSKWSRSPILSYSKLTQTAQLFNDGCQRAVGDTLQLTGHPIRQRPTAQVPGLNVPLHQRHAALLLWRQQRKIQRD